MRLMEEEKQYLAGTYGRFSLEAVSGRGAVCQGADGREYVDFTSGIGVNALGFCDPDWAAAVAKQAATLQHTSNLYYTRPMVELAKRLCQRTFAKKVFFCNSGAEANEGIIKAARKYGGDHYGPGRKVILCLENSFHGRTVTTLAATGQEVFHKHFFPFPAGFRFLKAGDLEGLRLALESPEVCGLLVELIQGEGGVVPLEKGYVQAAWQLCQERDVLFMVDEVQTGVGRTGKLLCSEQYGITPDLASLAKGLGGGLPLGAVLLGEKCADTLGPGDHGSTFGGNPVACAGGCVVLDKLDEGLLAQVERMGAYLTQQLLAMPRVASVEGLGMMLGITLQEGISGQLAAACLEAGVMVLTAKEKLRLLPPLTLTKAEADLGLERMAKALSGVAPAGTRAR